MLIKYTQRMPVEALSLSAFFHLKGIAQVSEQKPLRQSTNCQHWDLSVLGKSWKVLGNLTMGKANCLTVWLSYRPAVLFPFYPTDGRTGDKL